MIQEDVFEGKKQPCQVAATTSWRALRISDKFLDPKNDPGGMLFARKQNPAKQP